MIFVNYRLILTCGVCVALLLLGLGIYRLRRSVNRVWLRQSVRLLASGLVGLSSLLLLLFLGCGTLAVTNSDPIYSPNHRYAVRVSNFDAGGLGGDTTVSVYRDHGFKSKTVLFGGWKAVEAKDIQWLNDTEILIRYPSNTGYGPLNCENYDNIQVKCVAAQTE